MNIDFLKDTDCLSIIGMCKNAGKTTLLNHILSQSRGVSLGLTSIGRDGEAADIVTGTKKPGVWVEKGWLIATAAGLLSTCDITREIIHTTGINTPLGEVIIVRARSDGNVQLAGPSMVQQLIGVRDILHGLGAKKVIIDGAFSRHSLCSPALAQAAVLCVGASCGKSMKAVVEEAAHICNMLNLPRVEHCEQELPIEGSLVDALRHRGASDLLFLGGGLTDGMLTPVLEEGMELGGVTLVVRDASRILLSQKNWERLQARRCNVKVLDRIKLVAVAINPISHQGLHFDSKAFRQEMQGRVSVPVINVEEGYL